jgi:P27 family predicted phage terminase small subunit
MLRTFGWSNRTAGRCANRVTQCELKEANNMTPPKHLSSESKKTYRRVAEEYDLTPDAEMLLRAALENWDRAQAARELVTAEGLVQGGKRHPAIDVEKQAYGLFQRFMRQLGLDILPPGPVGRPSTSV